jgi:hypothetical protein
MIKIGKRISSIVPALEKWKWNRRNSGQNETAIEKGGRVAEEPDYSLRQLDLLDLTL